MNPVESQSAFGFYQKEKDAAVQTGKKRKPTHNSSATRIKTKYAELCNKKKNQKLKAKKVSKAVIKTGIADWTVRRGQFEELKNGRPTDKSATAAEEDSRTAGKKTFLHLLSPIEVDRFMGYV